MRYLVLLFLFTAFISPPEPAVEWTGEIDYDFGNIPQGKPVRYDFQFRNLTDSPLTVDNVRTTCGCTASDWSEIPTLPDSLGAIHIEYDARKKGYFYKKIKVFFHDHPKGELLTIQGYVEEEK